jgi:cysteine-rich repeat protein
VSSLFVVGCATGTSTSDSDPRSSVERGDTDDGEPPCDASPPPPPCCGDGHVDDGEQCDDGNTKAGDGCSATCETESDHCDCPGGGDGDACPIGPQPGTAIIADADVHLVVGVDVEGTRLLGGACTAASIELPIDVSASVQLLGDQLAVLDVDALPTLDLDAVLCSIAEAGGSLLSGCIPSGVSLTDATAASAHVEVNASGAACELFCALDLDAQIRALCPTGDDACVLNVRTNYPSACTTACCTEGTVIRIDVNLDSLLSVLDVCVLDGDLGDLIGRILHIASGVDLFDCDGKPVLIPL